MTIIRGFQCDGEDLTVPCGRQSMTGTHLPLEWQLVQTELGEEHFCNDHPKQCTVRGCRRSATLKIDNLYLCDLVCPSAHGKEDYYGSQMHD